MRDTPNRPLHSSVWECLPPRLPSPTPAGNQGSAFCIMWVDGAPLFRSHFETESLYRAFDADTRYYQAVVFPLEFLCLASMITNQLLTKINSLKWGSDKVSPTRCQITRLLRPLTNTYNILMLLGLLALKVFWPCKSPSPGQNITAPCTKPKDWLKPFAVIKILKRIRHHWQ